MAGHRTASDRRPRKLRTTLDGQAMAAGASNLCQPTYIGPLLGSSGLGVCLGAFVVVSTEGPDLTSPLWLAIALLALGLFPIAVVLGSLIVQAILKLASFRVGIPLAPYSRIATACLAFVASLALAAWGGCWAVGASGLSNRLLNDVGLRVILWRHEVRFQEFTSAWLSSEGVRDPDELVRELGESVGCCAQASWNPSTRTVHLPFAQGRHGSEWWERGLVLLPSASEKLELPEKLELSRIHEQWHAYHDET